MVKVTRTLPVLCAVVLAAAPLGAQRRSNVITAEEIERAPNVGTAYDAVQTLRPRWLGKAREVFQLPGAGPGDDLQLQRVHVYLNEVDAGGVDYLKTIPAERVFELRWLSANAAASRYGPTDGPGIVVTLKR